MTLLMSSRGRGPTLFTTIPNSDVDAIHHLTDMVGQFVAQIGESIIARLMSVGVAKNA